MALGTTTEIPVVAVTLDGTIKWTDSAGNTHPVRQATVKFWDADFGSDELVTVGSSGITGFYSASFDNNDGIFQGNRDIYLEILADGPFHYVSSDGTQANTYSFFSTVLNEIPDGTNTLNITIPNTTTIGQAFSVNDAVYTASSYATSVRGLPQTLPVAFPVGGNVSFYQSGQLNITSRRRDAWDVIHHEYGHFLADLDSLDMNPGGSHSFGTSNIPPKNTGVQLAWGEGVASYLGIAAQQITAAAGQLPSVPKVGDTFYDSIDSDNPANSFRVDLETTTGSGNAGEGDEASVMRILWDLADGKNEAHDEIALGDKDLYDILNNKISGLDQLDDLWDYFFGISNDAERTKFGSIFEEYDVSPAPFGGPIGKAFSLGSTAPTFEWVKNNNNANDAFQVIVFNSDFSMRELDFTVPGDVTEWTPTQAQWDSILNNGSGLRNFIIAGSDTTDFTTGSYWSGARNFEVEAVPEPATILGSGLALGFGVLFNKDHSRKQKKTKQKA